jgi:hypothetical protein
MSNIIPHCDSETTHGRKLERLRWHEGKLQQCFSEKYERYERGRFLAGGIREVWEDVPGDPPASAGVEKGGGA